MSAFLKILVGLTLLITFLIGISALGNSQVIQDMVDTIGPAIEFIRGSIQSWTDVFPWFIDAFLMFSAVLVIEGIMITWKLYNYLHEKIIGK